MFQGKRPGKVCSLIVKEKTTMQFQSKSHSTPPYTPHTCVTYNGNDGPRQHAFLGLNNTSPKLVYILPELLVLSRYWDHSYLSIQDIILFNTSSEKAPT